MTAQAMYIHGEKIVTAAERYEGGEAGADVSINKVLQDAVDAVYHPTTWSSVPGAH